jgi:hypothetical protein
MNGATLAAARGSQGKGKLAVARDAYAHDDACRVAPSVHREPALPGVECLSSHVEQALCEKDWMALAQVHCSAADLGARPTPKEKCMNVRALDAFRLTRDQLRVDRTLAQREFGSEREWRISIRFDDHRDGLGESGIVRRLEGKGAKLIGVRSEGQMGCSPGCFVGQKSLDRAAYRVDHFVEGHCTIVGGYDGIGSRSIHAEAGRRAEPLDA